MKLNIEVSFTDKYTNEDYKVGDVIEVSDERGNELLNDPRKLVSLNEASKTEDLQYAKNEEVASNSEQDAPVQLTEEKKSKSGKNKK